jgi:DNA polymerase-1
MKIAEHATSPYMLLSNSELRGALNTWKDHAWILDTETTGLNVRGEPAKDKAYYIGMIPDSKDAIPVVMTRSQFDEVVRPQLNSLGGLVGHNLRFDLHALNMVDLTIPIHDTSVWNYYHSTTSRKSLDFLAAARGWKKIATPDELKKGKILSMSPAVLYHYLADDCLITQRLFNEQMKRATPQSLQQDFELEVTLAQIENRGVLLNTERLDKTKKLAVKQVNELHKDLKMMGFQGLITSPKQVGAWLELNGRRLPKTPSGSPSTSRETLTKLADQGDTFAQKLLEWRKMSKLIQAFLIPLPNLALDGPHGPTIYASINSTRTSTGRFSCDSPNLQQIPKGRNSELGKEIRSCLTHTGGVSVADYSQVELRVAAALSEESVLLQAFQDGGDPHTETAAAVFKKSPTQVTDIERHAAKTVNFGILFGAGPTRLSTELKISMPEARKIFNDYKSGLPSLAKWCDVHWAFFDQSQVATTISGRTRIFANNEDTRPGLSVLVQGTASELMRRALIDVEKAGLNPILSVHDEIVCQGRGNHEELARIMQDSAEKAFPKELGMVCFPAEGQSGPSWGELE